MKQRSPLHRFITTTVGLVLVASACGSDEGAIGQPPASLDGSEPRTESAEGSTTEAGGSGGVGWIEGAPDWSVDDESFASATPSAEFDSAEVASAGAEGRAASDLAVEPGRGGADEAASSSLAEPADDTPLRAGSVDDNADFDRFLAYLDRIDALGIPTRDLDPTGRTVLNVVDEDGRPVPGALVTVTSGQESVDLRTTADGTARFHPGFYGWSDDLPFEIEAGGVILADAAAGGSYTFDVAGTPLANPVPLDVLFLLDATGSMGDEIDRLKQTVGEVADRVAALDPAPDVRFAMTLYRDEDDSFVTVNYDFTADIAQFQEALDDVVADGGGDYPEALDEGLADALTKPAWRNPADAVQLIFVIADAPPQIDRQVEMPYTDSIRASIERGIKIFPIASSESDDQAEAVFRQMAQATGAPFVFLSNGAAGASLGESSDISSVDYEELALDELVVRLIAEELSDLAGSGTGGDVTVPTTVAPPPTNPDGQ